MFNKKLIQKVVKLSIVFGISVSGLVGSSGSILASTYNCTEGNCCECSSVLGSAINKIISRDRFNPSVASYSGANFRDDVREGVHEKIASGTEYDYELAKYEMVLLINNYFDETAAIGKTVNMYVKEENTSVKGYRWITQTVPWSKENAIAAFGNAYQQKFDESSNTSTARQQAANIWNNDIIPYISCFNKTNITMDDIRDILKKLGIDVEVTMSLENIRDQLGHTHNGTADECECSHVCSKKRRLVIQDSVQVGNVGTYNYYIRAKVTSSDPLLLGVLTDEINIGVKNIGTSSDPFYVVGECVCRLGAKPIIIPAIVTPVWADGTNFIQPEGLTNVDVEIDFDKKVKDISYTLDFSGLKSDELNGKKIIEKYDLSQIKVQIFEIGTPDTLVSDTQYTIVLDPSPNPDKIRINFNDSTSTTPFYAEEGSKYRIKMYIPTTIGSEIQYGLKPLETETTSNSYVAKIVGDPGIPGAPGRKIINLNTELKATVRICEAKTILGVFYDEVYNDIPSVIPKDVKMNYIEIAKIS